MPTFRKNPAFHGGELSPKLRARVDLEKYASGLATCRNFYVAKEAILENRPGFEYVCEVKDSAVSVRLGKFVFNADSDQVYVLELGNQYMRFIQDGAQVTVSSVTAWSGATAYVVGDLASRLGINYYCIEAHTNEQPPNATYWYALTGSIYEIPTPYTTANLNALHLETQSGDVVRITHPSYGPRKLTRTAHTTWVLAAETFAPEQAAPTSLNVTGGAGAGLDWYYVVTAINETTGEESLPSAADSITDNATPTAANPQVLTWTAPAGTIREYNVYRQKAVPTGTTPDGIYGFLGRAGATDRTFNDDGSLEPDYTDSPPSSRDPFASTDNYPSCSAFYQQRLGYANTNNNPETAYFSRSGYFSNFTRSSPSQDNDAVDFTLASRQVNEIRHMLDLGILAILTTGGATLIRGDESGNLKPTAINGRQEIYYGSSILPPVIVGKTAVYVSSRVDSYGNVVRDLVRDFENLDSRALNFFSSHLTDGYTLTDSAYQEQPNSIIWYVRSDGVLLSLTYIPEHEIVAWAHHDTDGLFERVVCVPEGLAGAEDALYVLVKRTIDGNTVRYIERMTSRLIDEDAPEDMIFMDSALTFDGWNTAATTMTLSGGTDWDYEETLTLTASASYFASGDTGNYIHLLDSDGELVRFRIDAFTNDTVVTGQILDGTVPASLRSTAVTTWGEAVDSLTGLDHLEGETVAILGDGYVVASPNARNSAGSALYDTYTVTSGAITLATPMVKIHVGLPYVSDVETLDLDLAGMETMAGKKKLVTRVLVDRYKSRGGWCAASLPEASDLAGPTVHFSEIAERSEELYDEPVTFQTRTHEVTIRGEWSTGGRCAIRQVDPLPMSLLAISPTVTIA